MYKSFLGSVVFHCPGDLVVSPLVHGSWNRPLLDLLVEAQAAGGFGNDVGYCCAEFVGWCMAQQPRPGMFGVANLPGRPWAADDDFDPWAWYDRVMAELAGWDPPALLVDLDNFEITRRGEVLWPPPERRRPRGKERRSRPPGEPFPCGWSGTTLGGRRPGQFSTNHYPPDELPPLPVALTGSLDWLRAAPEAAYPTGGDVVATAAALDRLLAAHPNGLPPAFVTFLRSPDLWGRIERRGDWSINLDPAAVEILGGPGHLIRFLSDSQWCCHWNLHLYPGGERHAVVTSYHFTGSGYEHLRSGRPHPRDLTTCAPSFEAFLYRTWFESRIANALRGKGPMPEHGEEYLAFYRTTREQGGG